MCEGVLPEYVPGACGGQWRARHPLELELETVVPVWERGTPQAGIPRVKSSACHLLGMTSGKPVSDE